MKYRMLTRDDEALPITAIEMRRAVAVPHDSNEHDADLDLLMRGILDRIENLTGNIVFAQTGVFTLTRPDKVWSPTSAPSTILNECLVPVRCSDLNIEDPTYFNGTEATELEIIVSSPAFIRWTQPSDIEYIADTYQFPVELTPVHVSTYKTQALNALSLAYNHSQRPDIEDRIVATLKLLHTGL